MLSISACGFILALLPAVRESFKGTTSINLFTSVTTAVLLTNTSVAILMLGQTYSGWLTVGTAALWSVLAFNRWRQSWQT